MSAPALLRAHQALRMRLRDVQTPGHPDALNPPSPCVSICRLDAAGAQCLGCLRRVDELVDWGRASAARRLEVWVQVGERLDRLQERAPAGPGGQA